MASSPGYPVHPQTCDGSPWTARHQAAYDRLCDLVMLDVLDWIAAGRPKCQNTGQQAVSQPAGRVGGAGNDRAMAGEVVSVASLPPVSRRRLAADAPQRSAIPTTLPPYTGALNTTNDQG